MVVGGGLSGLSAAYFFLTSAGPGARVLVLDNHDDFGGHAKRNEMTYRGRTLMLNGGTSYLESVGHYSAVCRTLLAAVGIDIDSANATSAAGRRFYRSLGLGNATFFGKEVFGEDRLVMGRGGQSGGQSGGWPDWLAQTPMSAEAQRDIARLYDDAANPDYMPGLSDADKKERLARISYRDFLLDLAKVHPDVIPFFDDRPKGSFCVGIDGHPALYGWAQGYPGFQGMNLAPLSPVGPLAHIGGGQHGRENEWDERPDIHFPDGNATLARLLVRAMIPDALPGTTLEDSMTSRLRYDRIDRDGSDARIRLNSMGVSARHLGDPDVAREVEITYVRGGKAEKVRARHCVMGCYNGIIPELCPEMSDEQKVALKYGVKMPLVYTNVLIRDWTSFTNLGISRVSAPGMYHSGASLGRSIQFGDYEPSRSPDDPMILHMTRVPCAPGLPKKEQHRAGREDLLATSFETFERNIRDQLGRMLEGGGFEPAPGHRGNHRESMAARIRLQLQHPGRSDRVGAVHPRRPAVRGRQPAIRSDFHRQLRCRRLDTHRLGHRRGASSGSGAAPRSEPRPARPRRYRRDGVPIGVAPNATKNGETTRTSACQPPGLPGAARVTIRYRSSCTTASGRSMNTRVTPSLRKPSAS